MKSSYGLDRDSIRAVQFYISDRIVLRRQLTDVEARVTSSHTLRRIDGKYVEELIIEPNTPCIVIATSPSEEVLGVSFEPGAYLRFTPATSSTDGRIRGRYYLDGNWRTHDPTKSSAEEVISTITFGSYGLGAILTFVSLLAALDGNGDDASTIFGLGLAAFLVGGVANLTLLSVRAIEPGQTGRIEYNGHTYTTASRAAYASHLMVNEEALTTDSRERRIIEGQTL